MENRIESRHIEELEPHPINEEIYDEPEVEDLVESIRENGFADHQPVLITEDNQIVSGHRRVEAAREAGLEEIPVLIEGFRDETEIRREILSSNLHRDKTPSQIIREGMEWRRVFEGDSASAMQKFASDNQEAETLREKIAQRLSISGEYFRQGRYVYDRAFGEVDVADPIQEEAQRQWEQLSTRNPEEQTSIGSAYDAVQEVEEQLQEDSVSDASHEQFLTEEEIEDESHFESQSFPENSGNGTSFETEDEVLQENDEDLQFEAKQAVESMENSDDWSEGYRNALWDILQEFPSEIHGEIVDLCEQAEHQEQQADVLEILAHLEEYAPQNRRKIAGSFPNLNLCISELLEVIGENRLVSVGCITALERASEALDRGLNEELIPGQLGDDLRAIKSEIESLHGGIQEYEEADIAVLSTKKD